MIHGYASFSMDAHDLGNQVARLKVAGCIAMFHEKMSGTYDEITQFKKLLATADAGDV